MQYHYLLSAKPYSKKVLLSNYQQYFQMIKHTFNSHRVENAKEIVDIALLEGSNAIVIEMYTEKPLSKGRELQGARRISEALAAINHNIVVPKSHVLISVSTSRVS